MLESKTWLLLLLMLPVPMTGFLGLLLLMTTAVSPTTGVQLTDYIQHYEPVFYDEERLHAAHHRAKRATHKQLTLNFHAHGREFKVRLRRDTGIYSSDLVVENSHDAISYDTGRAYVGSLRGEKDTNVHGILTSRGIFEGKITTPNDTYVVERASRYFQDSVPDFHSVIYRHSDVRMNHMDNGSLCKADELRQKVKQWQQDNHHHPEKSKIKNGSGNSGTDNWIFKEATPNVSPREEGSNYKYLHHRYKRSGTDPPKTMCTLYVQADHLFYQKFDSNAETVIEQLTQHIQGVNQIYNVIDFDRNTLADNVTFIIKRIKVHTDPYSSSYKFPDTYGVETYLELFSEDNFDAFCLAYMFTYRDFEGGTLGLAWTGDLENAGGVCEKNGQFRGSLKSLNSGIVTILNYGKDVPSSVSHVTMAHEIGHNMGSQHDPETNDCSPGGENGNYIMFARATSGDKPNNNRFSRCSKSSMATVMEVKAMDVDGCFSLPTTAICGNEVVEEGEECDCGWDDECTDRCCNPQASNPNMHRGIPCTRKPRAACSPSQGPCCSDNCQLINRTARQPCRDATSCRAPSYCDGQSPSCPHSSNLPDKATCDADAVCFKGECTGSICLAYDLESCQCPPEVSNDFNDHNLCHMCCKFPGEHYPCRSSFEWNLPPYDIPDRMAQTGSPCNDYKGYCDVFHKCREVDPAGPLAHLRRLIFSPEGLENLKNWLADYWYVLVTAATAFVIFVVIFVKVCVPRRKKGGAKDLKSTTTPNSASTSATATTTTPLTTTTVTPAPATTTTSTNTPLMSVRVQRTSPTAGPKRGKRLRERPPGTPPGSSRAYKSGGSRLKHLPPSPPPPPYSYDDPYNTCHHPASKKLASRAHKEGWV